MPGAMPGQPIQPFHPMVGAWPGQGVGMICFFVIVVVVIVVVVVVVIANVSLPQLLPNH